MKQHKNETSPSLSSMLRNLTTRTRRSTATLEYCQCEPLAAQAGQAHDSETLLISRDLDYSLRAALAEHIERRQELGILVLHVFQHEITHIGRVQRRRYHVTSEILDQVLANIRRVIRHNDILLIHARTGAALLFPGVDQPGITHILERIYDSLDLLQGKTFQPPLARETTIQLGISTYPSPASSIEQLLAQAGRVARSLELQPALTRQLHGVRPMPTALQPDHLHHTLQAPTRHNIPFMDLPEKLPAHLTSLLPYKLARELHCAPVGRHQQTLTVALANPTNTDHVRLLQTTTGLAIFPVACDKQALNRLLNRRW